jgi:hypothetical protein
MRMSRLQQNVFAHWIASAAFSGLLIAPTACNSVGGLPIGGDVDTNNPFGLIINSSASSDVLGGIRLRSGDEVYAYGTRMENGNVEELTAVTLVDADGNEASMEFVLGRPTRAKAFDGSTVKITYDEVSEKRLAGTVELFFASIDETHSVPFDVDLEAVAAQIRQLADDLADVTIDDLTKPQEPAPRSIIPDGLGDKSAASSQLIILIFAPFFQFAYAIAGYTMLIIMTQVMAAVAQALVGVFAAVTQAVIATAFAPFLIMGNILQAAVRQPTVSIDLTIVRPAFTVPRSPRFDF